jgi:hypothetical protein
MRTRERFSTRLITANARSRLDRLLLPRNPTLAIDAYRNMQTDLLPFGRVTGTTVGALDGYTVISDAAFPVKRYADTQQRLESGYLGGTRRGYALQPAAENRIYQTDMMRTSGQLVNWVANAAALYGTDTVDPINLNNGGLSSQTASFLFATAANATVIQSATTAFAGSKNFCIWAKSLLDTPVLFDMQVTSGVWISKTATAKWQVFTQRISSGLALPGIRVPNAGDGVILWGPQLTTGSFTIPLSQRRLTLGPTPVVLNVKADVLRPKEQTKTTGTFVVDVRLNPLTNGDDYCEFYIGNFDVYYGGSTNGNWVINLYRGAGEETGGTLTKYGVEIESIAFLPFPDYEKRVKVVCRVEDTMLFVYANGTPVAELNVDNIVTPLSFYMYGMQAHVVSFYEWPELFTERQCIELSKISNP